MQIDSKAMDNRVFIMFRPRGDNCIPTARERYCGGRYGPYRGHREPPVDCMYSRPVSRNCQHIPTSGAIGANISGTYPRFCCDDPHIGWSISGNISAYPYIILPSDPRLVWICRAHAPHPFLCRRLEFRVSAVQEVEERALLRIWSRHEISRSSVPGRPRRMKKRDPE